ncbi:MAG TPA: CDP-alcohol phosphatidyltransferase family protein [Ignavibacteria bacterium]|nr:CDP-alcohol phosphatidyltransferase family protein [Ignavibacteria bacterium]
MSLTSEFKRSLKTIDSEEVLDLVIFRPVSFVLVKLIYPTNITPNQISIVALIFGILTGILYGFATPEFFIFASASFFICNTLDCMDGQLARLKKNGTKIGRVIDGFIDYITSISVFLGIGFAMTIITGEGLYSWALTIGAGISKALQNMFFDHYRNMYLEYVYHKSSSLEEEIEEYSHEKERLKSISGHHIEKLLISLYLAYSNFQKNSTNHIQLDVTPDEYKSKNKLLIRLWSWIGSTTHMVVLIIFSLMNRIDLYLIFSITLGNIIFIILLIWQKRVIKELSNVKRET